ncbi:hypothetical protein [Rossellomorea sp. y25]|uniref:hypothetical protein n=1 Tax=Rossellomorea sp. y25 TaxID=3118174 RepID=UPI0030E5F172
MTFGEFRELVKMIQGAFPHRQFTQDTAAIWFQHLQNCDYHQVKRRIEAHIKVSQYMPTIAELYEQPVEETTILQTIHIWEKEGAERIEDERRNQWTRPAPPWAR